MGECDRRTSDDEVIRCFLQSPENDLLDADDQNSCNSAQDCQDRRVREQLSLPSAPLRSAKTPSSPLAETLTSALPGHQQQQRHNGEGHAVVADDTAAASKSRDGSARSSKRDAATEDMASRSLTYLLRPENFHPLPVSNAVRAGLRAPGTKPDQIVPVATATGLPHVNGLLDKGQFRAAAITAALVLVTGTDATDHVSIFALLYARLASLVLLGLSEMAAEESKPLGDIWSSHYSHPTTGLSLLPWELRVLVVRLQALAFGDWRRAIMAYYDLAREARMAIASNSFGPADTSRWRARLRDLGLRVANALVEVGDLTTAAAHLSSMAQANSQSSTSTTAERGPASSSDMALVSHEVLVWLTIGNVSAAAACLDKARASPDQAGQQPRLRPQDQTRAQVLVALIHMANGDFLSAFKLWSGLYDASAARDADAALIGQNRAVCLLYLNCLLEVFHLPCNMRRGFPPALVYELDADIVHSRRESRLRP